MKVLDIPIPPKAISKLFKLKAEMNGGSFGRIFDQLIPTHTSDPTPASNSDPAPDPEPASSASAHNPPKRRNPTEAWRNRLLDIFPLGLESTSGGVRAPYTFAAHYLRDLFIHNRGNQYAERTIVKSAWYGKQVKYARHEFIVVHVEDPEIEGLKNCLAIERTQDNPAGTLLTAFSSPPAKDTFKIAYDGDLKRLLRDSHLTPHLELEEISFLSDEPLHLRELVTLVHIVSDGHQTYNLVDTNCYWFTTLIWECMRKMRPTANHRSFPQSARKKGRIGAVRLIPNPIQVRNVLQELSKSLPQDFEHNEDPSEGD